MMNVNIINNPNELNTVTPFEVSHLLWGTSSIPHTYGYLGFVPGDAFYLQMICEETDPLRHCTRNNDPVYQDSAMEAFFQFEPEGGISPVYLNVEMNANGALLAGYGAERTYRSYFTEAEYKEFGLKAILLDDKWITNLRIPVSILEQVYGSVSLKAGSKFKCNFYKISEDPAIEHYASYSMIKSKIPSFHNPDFFATAVIV